MKRSALLLVSFLVLGLVAPPAHAGADGAKYAEIVAAPDRSDADRALDEGREPARMLEFYGIAPGMKVAEIAAGMGYTAELLARAVGVNGVVYGVNNRWVLERFAEAPWSERLKKPVMKPVVRVDREFDDPLPPEAKDLDAVFDVLFYHDTVWMKTDRAKMNAAIFAALKPGGIYAVIDHSARKGAGLADVQTLHRIEESVVRKEIEAAGFELAAEADFLRNADDTRDWNASPIAAGAKRGTSDRFVLKFVKPAEKAR
jgi:predicted methyltransferase